MIHILNLQLYVHCGLAMSGFYPKIFTSTELVKQYNSHFFSISQEKLTLAIVNIYFLQSS